MPAEKSKHQAEVVELVKRLDPKRGDTLLVSIGVELDGIEQRRLGCGLQAVFPGVHIFLAGPGTDIEVVRHKIATDYEAKKEADDG
jgi:hypothetical protein